MCSPDPHGLDLFVVASGNPYHLALGHTSVLQVAFTPVAGGAFSNTVVFTSNGGGSSNAVTGTGLAVVYPPGDVNGNFTVTGADSLLINQVLVGLRAYLVTKILPASHTRNQTTPVTIYGIGFPTNALPAVTIGPPVNLTLTNVVVVNGEHILATIPPGGGLGTGTVNVTYATTNGVISFGRFRNE